MRLNVNRLKIHHRTPRGPVHAVDDVSLSVEQGETLGLVGESGCGKSSLARALVGLTKPTDGYIEYDGTRLDYSTRGRRRQAKRIQMVFQDPFASLNPRKQVRKLVEEPLIVHKSGDSETQRNRAEELLGLVGIDASHHDSLPHQLSGGQRQRVSIARALALNPSLLICDEPVSALDVSVQAQVLNLLVKIQSELNLSVVFISHDLSVVRYVSHRVAVMYLGKIVELGPVEKVMETRLHPYTHLLTQAAPSNDTAANEKIDVVGEPPNPMDPPSGCRFRTRCPYAAEICTAQEPSLVEWQSQHFVACHRIKEIFENNA